MSIIRHEIRQISDENRGQPIISQAVVHGNVAYLAGITPNPIVGDIKTQTAQVLRRVDELLKRAGTDKSQLLRAQVWIADMRLFEDHNSVWNEWVDRANPPARAWAAGTECNSINCGGASLGRTLVKETDHRHCRLLRARRERTRRRAAEQRDD
jgi:enamine deaminase RidA (YjgF/YER057c/UK114 family)